MVTVVRSSVHRVPAWGAFLVIAACAATEERPRTEDDARKLAPLPACILDLGSQRAGSNTDHSGSNTNQVKMSDGVMQSLREEQIGRLVFPEYGPNHPLPRNSRACTGRAPLEDPALNGGTLVPIEEGGIALGGGTDRLKVAWLRSLTFPDESAGGAISLLRSFQGTAEVYAVGSYRGRAKTLFSIERIGPDVVVVAQDDGCTGRNQRADCETSVSVFRPRFGVLERVARIAQERVTHAMDSEPGVRGRVQYRLSSSIRYREGGILVLEQVTVRDEVGREVRKAELERSFTFAPDGRMVVDEDSLWSRIGVPTRSKPSPPSPN